MGFEARIKWLGLSESIEDFRYGQLDILPVGQIPDRLVLDVFKNAIVAWVVIRATELRDDSPCIVSLQDLADVGMQLRSAVRAVRALQDRGWLEQTHKEPGLAVWWKTRDDRK